MSDNLTNTELLLKAVLQEIKWVKIAIKQKGLNLTIPEPKLKPNPNKGFLQAILFSLLSILGLLIWIVCKL